MIRPGWARAFLKIKIKPGGEAPGKEKKGVDYYKLFKKCSFRDIFKKYLLHIQQPPICAQFFPKEGSRDLFLSQAAEAAIRCHPSHFVTRGRTLKQKYAWKINNSVLELILSGVAPVSDASLAH